MCTLGFNTRSENVWLTDVHDGSNWWLFDVDENWVAMHVDIQEIDVWWIYDCGHDARHDVWMNFVWGSMCVRFWAPEFLFLHVLFTGKHGWYCLNLVDWLNCMWMSYDQGHFWKPFSSQIFTQSACNIIPFLNLSLKQYVNPCFEIFFYLELGWA